MTLPESVTDNGAADRNFRALDGRLVTVEPEAVTAPSFATGWSNVGSPYNDAGYYKALGRVFLRGAVANGGTGTGAIFTLPSDYRPPATVVFAVAIFGATGYVQVDSSGVVTDNTFSAASKTTTWLDSISFRAA